MANETQTRLLDEAHRPLIAEIWRAMAGLRSTVGFLNTGAHPDDETTGMLAALWLRDGVNLSYACSTRGEGGQNDIGTEAGPVLGTVRTAEMEAAAQVLDMRLYWHGQSPDDTITDFGFSKSGVETMDRWGADRLMQRFVEIVRTERPDILCPTFLDIPGQHGHHRAMTAAAEEVMGRAADPSFATPGLDPWQVSKLYLPAWSGAGGAYDDEVPPPPATITVVGTGSDPGLGASYARIGQVSRQFHRTQGMGRWIPAGAEHDWPLHLKHSHVGDDAAAVTDNLPRDLSAIGLDPGQRAIDACLAAFPDLTAMARGAAEAVRILQGADVPPEHRHRVARKIAQLSRLLTLTLNLGIRARPERVLVEPGQSVAVRVEHRLSDIADVRCALRPGAGQRVAEGSLEIAPDAPPADPYPDSYDPLVPRDPSVAVEIDLDGVSAAAKLPLEQPVLVLPARRGRLSETAAFINLETTGRTIAVAIGDASEGVPEFDLPEGWRQSWTGRQVAIEIPDPVEPGLYTLPLHIDGVEAATTRAILYDHIAPRIYRQPARLRVRVASVTLPRARIGYIGAGRDEVARWLAAAGFDVTPIQDADLAADAPFAGVDTVLVGVFAYRFRPALLEAAEKLKTWVRAGGSLVTLYHRPWDAWDPARIPPAPLEIGQPSLRWRITDEAADVTVLAPQHPVLMRPNVIGPEDWAGWHKERGLYFAKAWAPDYTPILRMADPGEAPLDGALLVGDIGDGRHTHVALNLHHQVTQLVPGAFRLFANILTPRHHG